MDPVAENLAVASCSKYQTHQTADGIIRCQLLSVILCYQRSHVFVLRWKRLNTKISQEIREIRTQ